MKRNLAFLVLFFCVIFFLFFFPHEVLAQVIINEFMCDPSKVSDSDGEWFELYNTGEDDVDIVGWKIVDKDNKSYSILSENPVIIPKRSFLVLCRNTDLSKNGGVNCGYGYSGFQLTNEEDKIILQNGNEEIDRVEYKKDNGFSIRSGVSLELGDFTSDNNIGSNWHLSTLTFGLGDKGTPGSRNSIPSTPTPSPTPTETSTPTDTPTPTSTSSPTPTKAPTPTPTNKPTPRPTSVDTEETDSLILGLRNELTPSSTPKAGDEKEKKSFPIAAGLLILGGIVCIGGAGAALFKKFKTDYNEKQDGEENNLNNP